MSNRPEGHPADRVRHVEQALIAAIGDPRFVPHLTLHETEAWVFAAAELLGDLLNDHDLAVDLGKVAKTAGGPELINDHPTTAPSKRLEDRLPTYRKTLHGPLSVEGLGLPALRARCPHLDGWLSGLEQRTE